MIPSRCGQTPAQNEAMAIKIWVNGHGWICGGNPGKGLRFTKMKAGAKPFDEFSKETFETRIFIEQVMQCNYDLIRR